jgi:hypothetical protein
VVTLPQGPVQAYDVELSAPPRLPPVAGARARVLVRLQGAPVTHCVLDVPPDGLAPADVAARLEAIMGAAAEPDPVDAERAARRRELAERGPHITVQIATRDRAA